MFVDSHCHLSFSPLAEDGGAVLARMRAAGVVAAVNVCTHLAEFERVHALALREPDVWCSVGVHPDHQGQPEPDVDTLVRLAQRPRVVAIGETGLDYYRLTEPLDWQRQRFRIHIHAARRAGLPLIVHSRAAARDTLDILREEGAGQVGGVMHCFTETREVAEAVLDLGFYISFSGIVSFRNADALRQVANYVPADRLLIETDAPYLAPVPMRGKTNEPANVLFVADAVARARGLTRAQVGEVTAENAMRLFKGLSVAVNATS
ncbi:MAG: TatD family hydrolase [Burkholderiaceae bacterium]|nr:TatD family hydrolase [Burkholderiaceae bacterium]